MPETSVLERFYGDKCVHYRVLKENIAKTCKQGEGLEEKEPTQSMKQPFRV